MSQSLIAVFVSAFLLCPVIASNDLKQFLNIRAPETALHAPVVFTLDGKTTLIGLYYRDRKRDVSAMQLEGEVWQPMGDNGLTITQVGGNFLSAVAIDSRDSPWVLTYYTRPSNGDRADCFYLYHLQGQRWVIAGPQSGHKADYSGGEAFVMLDGQTPVLFYRTWNRETQSNRHRVFLLRDGQWAESRLGDQIPDDASVVTSANRVFVKQSRKSQILIREITDVESQELPEPQVIIDLPVGYRGGTVYFEKGNLCAVQLYDSAFDSFLFSCLEKDNEVELQELPKPDGHLIVGIRRMKDGEILVATNDLRTARVYRQQGREKWELLAAATEASGGFLEFASFTVLDDGTPIVTWEHFIPH